MINDDLKCLLDYIVVDKRLSNDFTERLHNKIKMIKRMLVGYKKYDFFSTGKVKILRSYYLIIVIDKYL